MTKHCGFPEIQQYRNVVRTISDRNRYVGKDENGNAVYDITRPLPTLTFTGTVKLHGTNSGVTMTRNGLMYPQSRENVISLENDNAGFASFVDTKKDVFETIFNIFDFSDFDYLTIFGEWCGNGIQKGVAICGLPKMFVVFDIKGSYDDEQKDSYYFDVDDINKISSHDDFIYNIYEFQTYTIDIDFSRYESVQNKLLELTKNVGDECPVGKALGSIGIGEGIVWSYRNSDGQKFRFKVKDERHAGKSKIKILKPVDDEKLAKIYDIAEKVTPVWRLSQMIEKSCDVMNGGYIDRSKLGVFIKMVIDDIVKEDMDILEENEITVKDISKVVSEISKKYFFERENE